MARSAHPQPPPHGTLEALQVRDALLELLRSDLALALELIVEADDERGGLRTLVGYTRQVVPGRSKPVEQLVAPTPEAAHAAIRACAAEELRTRVLPPLARAFRAADPEARLLPMDKAAKLVIDLARRLASPTWREQLLAAHALLLARREAAAVAAEERRRVRAEARRPWAPDEVHEIAGHLVQRTDDGAYRCTVCGWVWKRKPQTRTECPGLPRYVKGTVPEHLKTERQLRQDDRVAPTGPAVAVLHLRHQSGVGFIPLYDVAQVRPLQQRAPARRRCQRCRAFIEREAADQQHCANCGPIAAEEQARQEALRQARLAHKVEQEAQRPVVPLTVEQILEALGDLWLLNRRARTLDPDTREHAYALKSTVLASIWRSTGAANAPLIRNASKEPEASAAHFGLAAWEFSEQHVLDLGQDANGQHLGVAVRPYPGPERLPLLALLPGPHLLPRHDALSLPCPVRCGPSLVSPGPVGTVQTATLDREPAVHVRWRGLGPPGEPGARLEADHHPPGQPDRRAPALAHEDQGVLRAAVRALG